MRGLVAAVWCGAIAIAPAYAQERPPLLPTRDVDVTYRSEQSGQVLQQRSRFSAVLQRMRVDAPTPGVYTIMDYRTHVLDFISDADHAALETRKPTPATPPAYARRDTDQVAGLPCTEWEVQDNSGVPALTCFTADGVMLRVRHGAQVLAVATKVSFAPLDPALFDVPPGYERVQRSASP